MESTKAHIHSTMKCAEINNKNEIKQAFCIFFQQISHVAFPLLFFVCYNEILLKLVKIDFHLC